MTGEPREINASVSVNYNSLTDV